MSDPRHDWREALAPTPACLELTRLGDELDATERAHVDGCARCQSELALFGEITSERTSAEEEEATRWIAELVNVVTPFQTRRGGLKARPALLAAAAVLLMVIGASWFMQMREPAVDVITTDPIYRSVRLEVIAPTGEIAQAPNELRWSAVPNASRYLITILEVDATVVWSGTTTQSSVALPPAVAAQFAPGKTLLWEVRAFRGSEELAASETQNVRVSVPVRKAP